MTVSSRTPEGQPGRCPTCGHAYRVEPSRPPGDATCPRCGGMVWPAAAEHGCTLASRLARFAVAGLIVAAVVFILVFVVVVILGVVGINAAGLDRTESLILTFLGVLLFGRKLPDVAARLLRRTRPAA